MGECEIEITGKIPTAIGLDRRAVASAARFFASKASRRAGRAFRTVSVVLQDDAGSDAAHRAVMGVAGATDVITQPYNAIPGEAEGVYGELYVNCERAISLSRAGWPAAKELLLYIAHGMDHLSGADDGKPADRARMRRRELGWLRERQC